ncbi:MAG: hypothetical protein A2583_07515 [Bdellovibrionales bacterium RIFOXYD1_FULL_53_11]|nr:MAG: hypothetical protein A2583_07515 [Bdellovibrionales bacterium RIFOXYD1_FULL_53_11]
MKKYMIALCFALLVAPALNGCGKGKVPGLENFSVAVVQKRLYASFTATALQWDFGITVPIPGLKDATAGIAPDMMSGGTIFQFSIGLESLVNNGQPLPRLGLPDGRPIPDVADGVLPRSDTHLKSLKLSIYLADDAFGIFVPITFRSKKGYTLPWVVSMKIRDERGNVLGKAYAIPEQGDNTDSGLLLLLPYMLGQPMPAPSASPVVFTP